MGWIRYTIVFRTSLRVITRDECHGILIQHLLCNVPVREGTYYRLNASAYG